MSYVASRLSAAEPSASMAASQAAKALRAGGVDVIDLGLTDPDIPTPNHIIDAAHFAAKAGQTLYTAAARTGEVREAIAGEFRHENGLDYTADEIVVANGEARRDLVVDGIRKINGLTLSPPEGALTPISAAPASSAAGGPRASAGWRRCPASPMDCHPISASRPRPVKRCWPRRSRGSTPPSRKWSK